MFLQSVIKFLYTSRSKVYSIRSGEECFIYLVVEVPLKRIASKPLEAISFAAGDDSGIDVVDIADESHVNLR